MPKIKKYEFEKCVICGKDGIHMWFCGKVLCPDCASKEFKKYMKRLMASIGLLVLGYFIF